MSQIASPPVRLHTKRFGPLPDDAVSDTLTSSPLFAGH